MAFLPIALIVGSAGAWAQSSDQTTAEIRALPWQPAVHVALPQSNAQITSLPGYLMVTGANAQRMRTIEAGGIGPQLEAEGVNPQTNAEALYLYVPSGHISEDDWSQVQSMQLLEQIKANTEAANGARTAKGFPALHVQGWVQEPTYNRDSRTVLWAIDIAQSDGKRIFNAVALKLGRYGYERIIFIDDASKLSSAVSNLLVAASAHQFAPGATYTDYVPGVDRAATYGIAGLVAGVLGVSLIKAGVMTGLAIFAKKLAWIILLPFILAWKKLRRSRKRTTQTVQAAPPEARVTPRLPDYRSTERRE